MPALPSVNKVLKVAIEAAQGDAVINTILHFAYAGATGSPTDLSTLAQDIYNAWASEFMAHLVSSLVLEGVKLTDLSSDTAPVGEYFASTPGSSASAPLPSNVAMVLSHHIARRYRGGHPRTYLAGVDSTQMTNTQQWSGGALALFLGQWNAFQSAVEALSISTFTPLTFVSVSYRSGNAARVTPVVDSVLSTGVQDRICTQRRRLGQLLSE